MTAVLMMVWRGAVAISAMILMTLIATAVLVWFAMPQAHASTRPGWLVSAEKHTGTAPCKGVKRSNGEVAISWYSEGARTADGRRYDREGLSAAHPRLPFGTKVKVTVGKREVVVRINDRGPARWTGCTLDVSLGAARRLGFLHRGVVNARIVVLR